MNNAAWTKTNATVSPNVAISPDGYTNACKLIPSSGLQGILQQNHNITATQANTISVFAKAGELNIITVNSRDNASASNAAEISFNLSTGVISIAASATGAYSAASGTITNYGNGWYRLTLTHTSSISTTTRVRAFTDTSGDGTKGLFVWGFQFETNASYASSYVNTLGASVTRGVDLAQKTSATALIGQTEGVLFIDFVMEAPEENRRFSLSDGTTSNRIFIGQTTDGKILFFVSNSSTTQVSFSTSTSYTKGTRLKIALAYKQNDFTGYINGEQIFTDSTGTVPSTSKFSFSEASDSAIFISSVNQALLFKTSLSNSELASLTTI
jgi:hypothetical protein